jgi:hypothetical protein
VAAPALTVISISLSPSGETEDFGRVVGQKAQWRSELNALLPVEIIDVMIGGNRAGDRPPNSGAWPAPL